MRLRNFRLWIILFGLVMIIGAILYQQSQTNRAQLENQAVKGMEITRKNVLNAYVSYHEELEGYIQRKFFSFYEIGPARKQVADTLNKAFGNNIPIVDSCRFIIKDEQGEHIPEVKLNTELPPIALLDLNHPLGWNPFPYLEGKADASNGSFFTDTLKSRENPLDPGNTQKRLWLLNTRIPLEKLMKKDRQNRFFDAIILTDEKGIAVYPDSLAFMQVLDFSKIKAQDTVSHLQAGVKLSNIEISNVHYKGFYTPLRLRGQELYLVGLKETGQFEKVGLKINFTLLSTLIFALIMLFCTVPIISVLTLQRGDILNQSKVFGVGLSLMLLMIILGFGTSFQFHLEKAINVEKPKFTKLPDDFRQKYRDLENQLEAMKTAPISQSVWENASINELLLIKDKHIQKLYLENKAPLDFGTEPSFIQIANREYVAYFNPGSRDHYIGAHYSRGSGLLESVISRKIDNAQIEAITFSLEKQQNDFGSARFLIIKEDGKVLFKSEKIATPLDRVQDALTPAKWNEMESLMWKNRSGTSFGKYWEIPLYLNGHQYVGILQMVENKFYDQPVWVIYLINKNLNHMRSSLISTEAVSLIMVYLLLLVIISLITKFSVPPSSVKQFHFFTYDWLYPSAHKRPRYLLLILLFTLYLLLLLVGFHSRHFHMLSLFCLAALITTQASISLFLLVGPHSRSKGIRGEQGYLISMGVLWLGIFIGLIYLQAPVWIPLILLLMVIGLVLMKVKGQLDLFGPLFRKEPKPSYNTFVGFMCLWSLLVGFVPGYALHSKVHNFEMKIWRPKAEAQAYEQKTWKDQYENFRRGIFTLVGDTKEDEIRRFIAPERALVYQAFEHPKTLENDPPQSETGNLPPANFGATWLFYLLLLLVLAAMWFLIQVLVKKVYLRDFMFNKHIGQEFIWDQDNPFALVFLCGLDTQQNREWAKRNFKLASLDEILVDNLPENPDPKHAEADFAGKKGWIIENIHCAPDIIGLMDQINQWAAMARKNQVPLVLSSGKSWKELLKIMEDEKSKMRFSEIFSPWFLDIVPLDFSIHHKTESLEREMEFGYNQTLLNNKLAQVEDEENVILLIQRYNKAYYANIWAELNFQEKKVCYYFSKEGFFNYTQWDTLTELVQKGILYHDEARDRLFLFNRTFKHFLLTHITENEIQAFREDEKNNGNASTIQVAAVSFVLILVALIGYFDRNFLNEAYAYLSGFLGLLGTVYAMLSKGMPSLNFRKNK